MEQQAVSTPFQAPDAPAQQAPRDPDVVRQALNFRDWPCDRPLPKRLVDHELADLLDIGHSQFFKRKKRGDFKFLEVAPQLPDGKTLYSGALVDRWLDGERGDQNASSVGSGPSSRRFFAKHDAERKRPGRPLSSPTFGERR